MLFNAALLSLASILAVWVLYPAVVALVSKFVHRDRWSTSYEPFVSVIIATRDDPAAVEARVADCLAADYDPARLEVIIAVDGYASHRHEIERAVGGSMVRVVSTGRPAGKATALNIGVAASRGGVLVFTDTHQRFRPDTIRALVAPLADPRHGAVSGMLDLARAGGVARVAGIYWRYERWLRWCEARVHSAVGVTGAVSAMRRSLWSPLPAGLLLDDVYTPMRLVLAGYRVAFNPAAVADETRQGVAGQEYRRKVRTLTGVFQLCAWLPGVLLPIRNPIWAQFVFHKLLRLLTPYWMLAIAAWVGIAVLGTASVQLLVASAAIVAVLGLVARGFAMRAVGAIREIALMQMAVVVATANGVRGRWNVWQQ
jgi:poly-beta-1,6-N-acetyl-D-glucosamine synthase